MSHNCAHSNTVPLHLILSLTLNPKKQSRLYLEFSLPISASHCCLAFVMFRFKVLGLLACGFCIFGDVFCCCGLFSSSFFWDLQKGQSGPQPHFSWSFALSPSSLTGGLGLVTLAVFLGSLSVLFSLSLLR